jgi:hypothetical protein
MLDAQKIELRSIEELIVALRPIRSTLSNSDSDQATLPHLRLIKSNISAVLSFTCHSGREDDPEFRHVIEDIRRQCLMINGMISRMMFRQRWLFSVSRIEDIGEVLAHYEEIAGAVCRMCLLSTPKLRNDLLSAF